MPMPCLNAFSTKGISNIGAIWSRCTFSSIDVWMVMFGCVSVRRRCRNRLGPAGSASCSTNTAHNCYKAWVSHRRRKRAGRSARFGNSAARPWPCPWSPWPAFQLWPGFQRCRHAVRLRPPRRTLRPSRPRQRNEIERWEITNYELRITG